ncbi:hypothetical protein CO614_09140 [Lysobacteraceae bacterium NML120232]|nr:hypothetical protein CO608_08400 [Xanthomonadaceae bacterium NML08-0793]PJK09715.1 hypothetical protein CO614_09140 [Xanthomonadaceae bacterium NML120232]
MNLSLFLLSIAIALIAPLIAVRHLRPILVRVLTSLCHDEPNAAEFWVRSAYLLAVSGTLILMLLFGNFSAGASLLEVLHRALLLVCAGVFITIAMIARNIWKQVIARMRTQPLPPPLPQAH